MSCFKETQINLRQERYIILGDPVPLARPRFARGRVFDSQKMKKLAAANSIIHQHGLRPKFVGPLHMEVIFFMSMPRVNKQKLKELEGQPHKARPDFSNLLKFLEDIAQGVLYDDDAIIASVCGSKVYAHQPRTEVIITEMKV